MADLLTNAMAEKAMQRLMSRANLAPWAATKPELRQALATYANNLEVAELQLEGRLPVELRQSLTATQKRAIGLEILKVIIDG